MGKISVEDEYYTLVNVFTVAPGDQQRIYDEIVDVTDVIEKFPGFVSANVHLSDDGRRLVNYVQWLSKEHFHAMRVHPSVQDHFRRCRAIATFDSIFCRVEYTHEGSAS